MCHRVSAVLPHHTNFQTKSKPLHDWMLLISIPVTLDSLGILRMLENLISSLPLENGGDFEEQSAIFLDSAKQNSVVQFPVPDGCYFIQLLLDTSM